MTDSLIQADKQLTFFSSDQMPASFFSAEESGPSPEFTGARLFVSNPDTYRAIVALSAEGLGAIRIGRILHVSPNTVLAVRAREPESIDIEKRRIAGLSRAAARMCVEGIIEMLSDPSQAKKISLKDRGIVHGILVEKSELLSGSPTARLQTIGAPPAVEVVEYLNWLRSEYARRIGLGEGTGKQIEGEVVSGNGGCEGKDQAEIVKPGARGEAEPAPAGPETGNPADPAAAAGLGGVDQVPEEGPVPGPEAVGWSVGQAPHRSDDMPANIDPDEGGQNGIETITPTDLPDGKANQ